MDRRELIIDNMQSRADAIESSYSSNHRRTIRDKHGKKTRMTYKWKITLFFAIIFAMMLSYFISFFFGSTAFSDINSMTDELITSVIGLFSDPSKGRALTMTRMLTFGPMSYVILSVIIAGIITIIVSSIVKRKKTSDSINDGTRNFVHEPDNRNDNLELDKH